MAKSRNKKENKRESRNSEKDQREINDIIYKILRQQSHLKAHLNRLEKISPATEKEVSESDEKHTKGKGCILKTFFNNVVGNTWISKLWTIWGGDESWSDRQTFKRIWENIGDQPYLDKEWGTNKKYQRFDWWCVRGLK